MMNSQGQEQEPIQETQPTNFDSEVIKYLAMLHLNNNTTSSATVPTTTTITHSPVSSLTHRLSRKRSSPTSSSILRQKLLSKKPAISSPSSISLSTLLSPTSLQRTLSEPINFSPVPQTSLPINSPSPETVPKSASKPPLPPLRRTSSAPIPSDYQLLFSSNVTPPRQQAVGRTLISSPVSDEEESASSKRLKRMRESMQVMTDWAQQVLSEDDEQPVQCECDKADEADNGGEECVWVEENPGGSLTIHFRCPCGKAYEVLLSGTNCYYKLK